MKKSWLVAVLAILALGGCSTVGFGPGERIETPFTMPDGRQGTLVGNNTIAPPYLTAGNQLAFDFVTVGKPTKLQLDSIAEVERACRIHTGIVRPNELVAIASQTGLFALSSGLGLGLGVTWAFKTATFTPYAKEGAAIGAASGAATGLISTGGKDYTFAQCGGGVFLLFPVKDMRILTK